MNVRRVVSNVAVLLTAALLAACDSHEFHHGEVRSETRQIGSFDSIHMDGSARLEITVGPSASVSIEGPDGVIEHTRTAVTGGTLRISTRHRDWVWANGQPRITVRITSPHLVSLRLKGGNDVRLAGFNGGNSSIEVEGAAYVRASGQLDDLTVDMEGAGFADLGDLVVTHARVTVDGVGRVVVNPQDTLDATMNGVGAILYTGSPREVNTHMNGLGSISQERGGRDGDHHREERSDGPPSRMPVDPDQLQPEYDAPPKQPASTLETI